MVATRAEIGRTRRARTRAALIQAALGVYARLGPDAPTIDDLTQAAGIARGSFYNCFATREDLLAAVATEVAEKIEAELAPFRALPDPAMRLGSAVRGYIRKAATDPVWGWAVVRVALVAAPLGEAMRRNLAHDISDGMARGRFAPGPVQPAHDLVLGAGLMGMRAVLRGEADITHAEQVATLVLRGLGVADAEAVATCPLPPVG